MLRLNNWSIDRLVLAVLHSIVHLLIVLGLIGYLFQPSSRYFDTTTFWLALAMAMSTWATMLWASFYRIHLAQALMITIYLQMYPRFLQLIYAPAQVSSPAPDFSVQMLNNGLPIAITCMILFLIGLILPHHLPQKAQDRKNIEFSQITLWLIIFAFGAMSVIELIVYTNPNSSIFSLGQLEKANIPIYMKVFLTVVSADIFLFFIIVWYFSKTLANRGDELIYFIVVAISVSLYAFVSAMIGSRGGSFRIILYAAAIGMVLFAYRAKAFHRALAIALFAGISSIAVLPLSQAARESLINHDQQVIALDSRNDDVTAIDGERNDVNYPGKTNNSGPVDRNPNVTPTIEDNTPEISEDLVAMINRLSFLDYIILPIAVAPDPNCYEKYFNTTYYAKSIWNYLMPGDPFPEARLNTSNTMGICYRGARAETMPHYSSEVWGLPGLLYFSVPPAMALVLSLVIGVLVGLPSTWLRRQIYPIGILVYCFWVWIAPRTVFFSMGVDNSTNTLITSALRLSILVGIVFLIERGVQVFVHSKGKEETGGLS